MDLTSWLFEAGALTAQIQKRKTHLFSHGGNVFVFVFNFAFLRLSQNQTGISLLGLMCHVINIKTISRITILCIRLYHT